MSSKSHDVAASSWDTIFEIAARTKHPKCKMLRPKVKSKTITKLEKSDALKVYDGQWAKPPMSPVILEKVVTYLVHDKKTLWACYGTCFGWQFLTAPYLFRTLKLQARRGINADSRLSLMKESDYLPFVKRVKFDKVSHRSFEPEFFDNDNHLECFRALENVHDLSIAGLNFSHFNKGRANKCFGHFGRELRSLTLISPRGTRQDLFDFLGLFPSLDDIEISDFSPLDTINDTPPNHYRRGLKGRLVLKDFGDEGLLRAIFDSHGGMWFKSVVLHDAQGAQLVLDSCAYNVKTLRIWPSSGQYSFNQSLNVKCNTLLRSLEVSGRDLHKSPPYVVNMKKLLSTIKSPFFSEVVVIFSDVNDTWGPRKLEGPLREMYETREFKVSFCLEASDEVVTKKLRQLTSQTARAVELGCYDFLPSPPFVFSCTLAD